MTLPRTTFQLPKGFQEVCLGIIMIAILIYRPAGLTNGRELPWPFARVKARPPPTNLARLPIILTTFLRNKHGAERKDRSRLSGSARQRNTSH